MFCTDTDPDTDKRSNSRLIACQKGSQGMWLERFEEWIRTGILWDERTQLYERGCFYSRVKEWSGVLLAGKRMSEPEMRLHRHVPS